MLDNQTRMRSMLNLIEAVDQGKKINLNEGIGGALTGGAIGSMVGGLPGAAIGGWLGDKVTGDADADKEVSEDSESSSDLETLANDALDAAALSIQDALGVEHGDFAGTFFTGEIGENILEILRDYAREEMKNQSENDDSDYVDDEESNNSYYDSDREGDSNTRSNQFESAKSKTGKLPSMAHIKKMCKDGKTVAEICKMHPDCDRAELKQMVADCKKQTVKEGKDKCCCKTLGQDECPVHCNDEPKNQPTPLDESGEGNSSTREKAINDNEDGYDKWDPKHPNFAKNYKKYKTSNPEGTLKSFIAHLKKGALAEGVRLKKFRQVADILKTLPENNRKILAKRHCKIFENHNPRFNSKKFMTYIGLNEGDVEDFLARGGKIQQGAPTDKKTPRARNSSYTDHSMRKGEQGRRGRGYQDYDPDDHQSRNDDIDYPTKDIRKPEYESKQMNETYGNGEIEVNFINSGLGTTLGMKKVQAGSITLDNYGRPVMKVSSPFDAGNTLMANFDSKTGGWVVDLD